MYVLNYVGLYDGIFLIFQQYGSMHLFEKSNVSLFSGNIRLHFDSLLTVNHTCTLITEIAFGYIYGITYHIFTWPRELNLLQIEKTQSN